MLIVNHLKTEKTKTNNLSIALYDSLDSGQVLVIQLTQTSAEEDL
jgi:hypothetical protein